MSGISSASDRGRPERFAREYWLATASTAIGLVVAYLGAARPLPGKPGSAEMADAANTALATGSAILAGSIAAVVLIITFPSDRLFATLVMSVRTRNDGRTQLHPVLVAEVDGALRQLVVAQEGDVQTGPIAGMRPARREEIRDKYEATALDDLMSVATSALWVSLAFAISGGVLQSLCGSQLLLAPDGFWTAALMGTAAALGLATLVQFGLLIRALTSFATLRQKLIRQEITGRSR